jgi:RHS repeat-associated protein
MRPHQAALKALVCLLVTCAGLGAHAQTASSQGAAPQVSTPGQFAVSPSGAATYRIPLQVPPGVAGMQPKLELVYSSQSGNGFLGQGWGLSGLSTISRCARTQAQDGVRAGVNFDANDRFCLDGQRLVLVSGTYGVAGSEYRTELESFTKITALGSAGSGPASFLVKTKSGLTMEFGNTADSRIEAIKAASGTSAWTVGTVRAWAQNKLSDVKGNYLTIAYTEDSATGAYLPSRIDYSGNASSTPALTPGFSVVFVPSSTARVDAITGYQAGATYTSTKRITKIQTYAGASLVKDYRLDYAAQANAADRSKLSSITECDATGACLPATNVQWGSTGSDSFAATSTWLNGQYGSGQGWSYNSLQPRQLVDVNGDGLPDIVGFADAGVYVALSNGTSFASPSYWLSGEFGTSQGWTDNNVMPRQLVDVNGDNLPDIVGFNATGVYVALNTGTSFASPSYWLSGQFGTSQGWTDNNVMPRQLVDVNGDGRPDIVGFNATGVQVALNTGSGFATPTSWIQNQFGKDQGWTNNTDNPRQLVDINGDGLPDILGFAGNGVSVALNTGSGFETASSMPANYSCSGGRTLIGSACGVSANPVMGCPAGMQTSEYDGGSIDCHYPGNNVYNYYPIVVGYSCTSSMGSLQGSSCTIPASYSCPTGYTASGSNCTLVAAGGTASAGWTLAAFGVAQGWTDSKLHPRQVVDVNGDGLPDIVGFGASGVMVSINTGSSFKTAVNWISDFGVSAGAWTDSNTQPRQVADVNGDGLPDIVGFGPGGVMVALNTGSGFAPPTSWIANFGTAAGGWSDNNTVPRMLADVNGDGMLDIVGFSGSGVQVALDSRKATTSYLSSITTGTGDVTTPSYGTLASSSVYTPDTGANKAVFPQVDLAFPIHVVSQVERSNGNGSTSKTAYSYGGLKAEMASGRGMLGFRWVKSKNLDTQLESYTEYRQDFPYTGAPVLNEARLSGAGNAGVLKRSTTTYQCTNPLTAAACSLAAGNRYFVFPASTSEQAWDLSGTAYPSSTQGASYGVNPDGQFYGDLVQSTLSTSDGFSKTTANAYYAADTANWILGRLQTATATSVNTTGTKVRSNSFEYTAQGQLSKETQEPGSPNDCLQSSYSYDSFGNRSQVSTAACAGASGNAILSAGAARTSTDSYGADGRFPVSSSNALSQSETKAYDNRFGSLTSLTGPNSLTSTWQYDSFGRKTRESRADGTFTTWSYQLCTESGANCPSTMGQATVAWVASEQSYSVNAAVNAPQKRQYYDSLNRVVRSQTQGFDGGGSAAPTLVQDTEYDNQGRVSRQSNTYASTGTPVWTSFAFDALNRITSESHPDSTAAGGIATTSYSYNGPSSSITNAKGQSKTSTKNALGQVMSVTDAQGNSVGYQYDALGNLTQTNAAGSITTLQYNLRGNKIAMQDPAMGSWTYGYNVFGELVSQRDSLNQTTTLAYDVLGRMTKRTEPDLVSDWSYDTKFDGTACGKGIGKLCEAKADNNYKRTHSYDSLGRTSSTATVLDNVAAPAVVSETFDANTGRVASKTWPTGYQASYGYTALGYLQTVTGGGTNGFTTTQSYQVLAMNAQGQITQYKTGNNVTTVSSFDAQTQRLSAQQATLDGQGSGNVLNQAYTYDPIGNLLTRADTSPNVGTQESFSYDSLNRLTTASILGGAVTPPTTTEVLYDTRGNITYKSDVGRYWYDAARPNRMTNVTLETAPGGTVPLTGTRALSYAFDDYSAGAQSMGGTTVGNGNLTYTVSQDTVNGKHTVRFESYTSFNMPAQITYGNFTSNSTTCPPGYTLANGLCTQSTNTAIPAQKVYSCPVGQVLSGTSCTLTTTTAATPNYSCPAGYTVSGSNCVNVSTVGGTPIMGCPSGYPSYGDNPGYFDCKVGNNYVAASVVGYSCPSGYSLSGSSCTKTTTVAATIQSYSCSSGWTLAGGTCTLVTRSDAAALPATPIYACSPHAVLNGSSCNTTVNVAGSPIMGCPSGYPSYGDNPGYFDCKIGNNHVAASVVGYSCPSGYTLSGSSCVKTVTTSASIASYSCPAGRTLVGTGCVTAGASFAGYACDVGTLNGNTCIVDKTSTVTPGSSNASDRTLGFVYGPEHQRIKQSVTLSGNGTSSYFSGNTWYLNGEDSLGLTYEREIRANGTTEHKHYLSAGGMVFSLFTSRTGTLNGLPATTTSYFHKDQLGSIAAITDETGAVTERLAYDPWGKRRFINSTPGQPDTLDAIVGQRTDRGYTEHEHLDEVGIIHMNGRIYDPLMGRFMSADPIIQSLEDLRSFNRYSYVWNNPLRMFDPTGYWTSESQGGTGWNPYSSPSSNPGGQMTGHAPDGSNMTGGDGYSFGNYSGHGNSGSAGDGYSPTKEPTPVAVPVNQNYTLGMPIGFGMSFLTGGYSDLSEAAWSRKDYVGYVGFTLAGTLMLGANVVTLGEVGPVIDISRRVVTTTVKTVAAKGATAAETVAARVITETGELRLSRSVAEKYAATRPYVTPLTVTETIAGGVRVPDPQGVAGRFMYTVDSIYVSGVGKFVDDIGMVAKESVGKFEVLVNEMTYTVEHALFKSGK